MTAVADEIRIEATAPVRTKRRELGALASFRYFAAATVVIHHYAPQLWSSLPPLIHGAVLGAYIWPSYFFVLSGFILTYSYLDPATGQMTGQRNKFYRARIARIMPTYWLAWAIIAPFIIMGRVKREALGVALAKLTVEGGVTFLGVNAFIPPLVKSWNYPGWTISIELFLYALFPFLLPWLARMRVRTAFFIAFASWALSSAIGLALAARFPTGTLAELTHLPPLHVHEFIGGIAAGLLYVRGGVEELRKRPLLTTFLQVGTLLTMLVLMEGSEERMMPFYNTGAMGPLLVAFVLFQAVETGYFARVLEAKSLRSLGRASYCFYIIQEPLMSWYRAALGFKHGTLPTPYFWAFFVLLTLTSIVVSHWFEAPARDWVMRLGTGRSRFAKAS